MVAILKEPYPLLRPMRLEDLEQVVAIEIEAYDFPWTLGIFRDCLRAGYNCWVLAQSVEVIGYGVLTVAAREAHILNVCVAKDQQSHGHGRHLMQRLVDLARCTTNSVSTKSANGRITIPPNAAAKTPS